MERGRRGQGEAWWLLPLKTLAALPRGRHAKPLGGLEMETIRSEAWSEGHQTVDKPRQSQGGQQEASGKIIWS